jgi:hypothetical protein
MSAILVGKSWGMFHIWVQAVRIMPGKREEIEQYDGGDVWAWIKDNNIEMNCEEIGCQGCDVMTFCEVSKPLFCT